MAKLYPPSVSQSPTPVPSASASPSPSPSPETPTDETVTLSAVAGILESLARHATELNAASDEWERPINAINQALRSFNIGLPVWERVRRWEGNDNFEETELGFAHVDGQWGLAIRHTVGVHYEDDANPDTWPFNKAPRYLRLQAADFIPPLLFKLNKSTGKLAKKMREKAGLLNEVAGIVSKSAPSTEKVKR